MKYLLPEFYLILTALVFTKTFIDICVGVFKFSYEISSISFFKYYFLAFPLVTLLSFFIIGYVRHLHVCNKKNPSVGVRIFLKENFIFFVVAFAFFVRILEATNETQPISPYWINQSGKLAILFYLISIFCISSVLLHLFFQIKTFFSNRRV